MLTEISDVAVELFVEQGYEQTTIGQIAERARVPQRSLFRYFGTKEELVCGEQDGLGELLVGAVAAQPAESSPWAALKTGFETIAAARHTPEQVLQITTLIFTNEPLRARYNQKRRRWQQVLVPVIRARLHEPALREAEVTAMAIIATSFACVDVATDLWVRARGEADPSALYERALIAARS